MKYGRDFLVYLAGPITGLTYADGQDWRTYAAQELPVEIRAMSPLRGKDVELSRVGIIHNCNESGTPLTRSRGIMTRDFMDCTRADAVLVNLLGAKSVSIGTVMEIAWAYMARIPVVVAIEKISNLHDHSMIRESIGFRVETLEDAIKTVEAVLMPEGKGTPRELVADYSATKAA